MSAAPSATCAQSVPLLIKGAMRCVPSWKRVEPPAVCLQDQAGADVPAAADAPADAPAADTLSMTDSSDGEEGSRPRVPLQHQFTYLDASGDEDDDLDDDEALAVDGELRKRL